ncbi:TolC family outer membrane protein [Marinicella sp. S1101]|uniref:TolC family outer membrane protein n=1 Tax=Marinicella marina TaxID=2996016 RepID=UPI002260FDB6|nr:TolC family outer membrane protein [Marinicella marina]MCX7552460.1 TolC family outer membrane protein [Marinicella marina]MDJ1139336.1 TolC family outer membrane protein [Marinicella marina]
MNTALEKDPQLRAAKFNQEASLENRKQAMANFLPQVSGSWSKSQSDSETSFDDGRFNNPPKSESDGWDLSLNQSIYNHANFVRLKQADLQEARGYANYGIAAQDFLIRVAQNYFDVLTNIDAVRFAESEEKAIQRQLEQAEQRYEVGLAAITDVHEARAQYDGARASVISAKNVLDDAREALYEITLQYYTDLNGLPDEFNQLKLVNDDVRYWEDLALQNNPTLAVAELDAEIAEKTMKIEQSGHYPTVSLSARRGRNNDAGRSFQDIDAEGNLIVRNIADSTTDSNSINLTVNVPIYEGGRVSSLTRQAKLRYKAAMEDLDRITFSTVRNVRSALQNVEAGWSSVQARQLAVVSAKSAEEATAAGFEVGTRNIVEVLNSQRSLYQAQRDYSRAKYDYLLNVLRLKQAAGILEQADILTVNALLTVQ